MCRLRLGVTFTNVYSVRVANESICENCGFEETISHLLCDHPRFSGTRKELGAALDRLERRPLSEERVLGHWPGPSSTRKSVNALLRFLRMRGLREGLSAVLLLFSLFLFVVYPFCSLPLTLSPQYKAASRSQRCLTSLSFLLSFLLLLLFLDIFNQGR